jgi:hypothetical protein
LEKREELATLVESSGTFSLIVARLELEEYFKSGIRFGVNYLKLSDSAWLGFEKTVFNRGGEAIGDILTIADVSDSNWI